MNETSRLNDEQKDYWGDASDYIYKLYTTSPAAKHVLNMMLSSVIRLTGMSNDSKIFEIGCAAGTQSLALADMGYQNIWGIDLSPGAIEQARKNAVERGREVNFISGDAADMNMFANESFDIVFSSGVMEHIIDLDKALEEQYRILKKGGHIYIQVPNTWCPWYWTGKKIRSALSSKQHFKIPPVFRTFTTGEMAGLIGSAGFEEIRTEVIGAVVPQCPNPLLSINITVEKVLSNIPVLRNIQALACVSGRKV